jgi:hypothetical protein
MGLIVWLFKRENAMPRKWTIGHLRLAPYGIIVL